MATTEQRDEMIAVCNDILALQANERGYFERREWGALSFLSIRPQAEMVLWLAKRLNTAPPYLLLSVPEGDVTNATNILSAIIGDLQRINEFKISQDNAQTIHSNYSGNFRSRAEDLMRCIGPWIPLLSMRDDNQENLSKKIREASDEAVSTLNETKDYVQVTRGEIDSVLQVARTQSGKAGAAVFTKEFEAEAKAAKERSVCWLIPTGILALAALVLSILFMFGLFIGVSTNSESESAMSTFELVYAIGGRVIGISVLFYAAIWSGRVALANMHLSSVNKHRAISLVTLQAFQEAVDDHAARDAVVLEAARAVYENVPSGYIGRQSGEHSGGGRILELIRSARPQSNPCTSGAPPQQ